MWSQFGTLHVRLYLTQPENTVHFLFQEKVIFIELDKWQPNSSNLKSVDYTIWGALQEKSSHSENTILEQLKFAIIDEYRNLGRRSIDCKIVALTLIESR